MGAEQGENRDARSKVQLKGHLNLCIKKATKSYEIQGEFPSFNSLFLYITLILLPYNDVSFYLYRS